MAVKPLAADKFRLKTDPALLPFDTTSELSAPDVPVGQERAMRALHFGARLAQPGYNIYVTGAKGSGKHRSVGEALAKMAATRPPGFDWCYVHNFADANRPLALRFAAGEGVAFRAAMAEFAGALKSALKPAFAGTDYAAKRAAIDGEFRKTADAAFEELRRAAEAKGLALVEPREGRFEFKPQHDGLVLSEIEHRRLPRAERDRINAARRVLRAGLDHAMTTLAALREKANERLRALDRETGEVALRALVSPLQARFGHDAAANDYLQGTLNEAIAHLDSLRALARGEENGKFPFQHFEVNLFVANNKDLGAPVVWLSLPTLSRLVGRIERVPLLATSVTDFMHLRSGALHHANGGFLLIEAQEIMQQQPAWKALKRALRGNAITIENLSEVQDRSETLTIAPAPIPLDVKIILFGEPWVFDKLQSLDHDFRELFKVRSEFASTAARDDANCTALLRAIGDIARRDHLRQLDRTGASRLLDEASRMAGDGEKISVRIGRIADLVREADACAGENGRGLIAAWDIERAIAAKEDRAGRLKALEQELIRRRIVFIDTDGATSGQVNALTMLNAGGHSFGAPARITARVGPAANNGIHIERLANYVGITQKRGVQTLAAYLNGAYSAFTPLSLSASIAFEQCYGPIDGDSASAAELIATLSAIADVPLKQGIGITGSIDQHGALQPVGAINQKIEGFFDICAMRGLDAHHGVIIPKANVVNLMLRSDIADAARRGLFSIYPAASIDDAIEILTDMKAGARKRNGFPRGSFNRRVVEALKGFARPRTLRPLRIDGWW